MLFRRNSIWWYDFSFRNQRVRESTHSRSKTVAREAEQQRRRDLERGIHNITEVQQNRIRALADIAADYLADYRLRYRGVTFAEYAVGHVVRLLGDKLVVDIDDAAVLHFVHAGALICVCAENTSSIADLGASTAPEGCSAARELVFRSWALSVVFCAIGPGVSPTTRKLRVVRYSIRKSTGGVSLAALAPALINSIVTCWPDLVAIKRFDCAGSFVMGLT